MFSILGQGMIFFVWFVYESTTFCSFLTGTIVIWVFLFSFDLLFLSCRFSTFNVRELFVVESEINESFNWLPRRFFFFHGDVAIWDHAATSSVAWIKVINKKKLIKVIQRVTFPYVIDWLSFITSSSRLAGWTIASSFWCPCSSLVFSLFVLLLFLLVMCFWLCVCYFWSACFLTQWIWV